MSQDSAAGDVQVNERLQPIHAKTDYLGGYKSSIHIRDIPTYYLDEPKDLGGENLGPTPLESVLGALGACTTMIVHILRRELRFDIQSLRTEMDGETDVRRVEMKRTGKKYHEVEPIAVHYNKVDMRVFLKTNESGERLEELKAHVARLCPVSRLIKDAGVPMTVTWIRE